MSRYSATVEWKLNESEDFTASKYSRDHRWLFDGGLEVPATASPQLIPAPYVSETNVDPEEALVAALSSCHMLFFLALAGKQKWVVESYKDNAFGIIGKNEQGKLAMTEVSLQPQITFQGEQPSQDQIDQLHHSAHERCFIANTVNCEVKIIS